MTEPDFAGAVVVDDTLPTADVVARVAKLPVLDRTGHARPFEEVFAEGPTLVIFVRHFFCGNCQEYLRTLSQDIPPTALAQSPTARRIVVVGCGDPALIDGYVEASSSAYSEVYADPTRKLYEALGMVSTLALGPRPAYTQGASLWAVVVRSTAQALRQIPRGLALTGGDQRQVGGEFLFVTGETGEESKATVTWCHRMKTTRDHTETADLKTMLKIA